MIALLSISSKILETLTGQRAEQAALETGDIPPTKFGAIKGRSVIDTLSILLHHTMETLDHSLQVQVRISRIRKPRFSSLLTYDISRVLKNTSPQSPIDILQYYQFQSI